MFGAPAVALIMGTNAFIAGTLGYIGITLFVGSIASRYNVVEAPQPFMQLSKNIAAASIVTVIFYLVFILIYLV